MLSKGKLLTSDIENVKGLKITQDISLHWTIFGFHWLTFLCEKQFILAVNADAVEN